MAPENGSHRLVGSGSWFKEAMAGLGCGVLYGITSPIVGHPLDTVKTKMQSQAGYAQGGAIRTLSTVVKTEGFMALWRGLPAPLAGSMVFRSVQFSAYGACFAGLREQSWATSPIPLTQGLQPRVLLGGLCSGLARALVETPLEFIKVRRQVGASWRLHDTWASSLRHLPAEVANAYSGFTLTFLRSWGLMGTFFVMVDSLERHSPGVLSQPVYGPFIKGGVCATLAWWLVWPFELLKNQAQAGGAHNAHARTSWWLHAQHVVRARGGVLALYRGLGPGSARSILANGCSMMVFTWCSQMFR